MITIEHIFNKRTDILQKIPSIIPLETRVPGSLNLILTVRSEIMNGMQKQGKGLEQKNYEGKRQF